MKQKIKDKITELEDEEIDEIIEYCKGQLKYRKSMRERNYIKKPYTSDNENKKEDD